MTPDEAIRVATARVPEVPVQVPGGGKPGQYLAPGDPMPVWQSLPQLASTAAVDQAPPPTAATLPLATLLTGVIGGLNALVTDNAALRKALNAEIARGDALAATLRSKGYMLAP